jgi:CDP-diacylglycerol---glycerol-3-phosphate 3-phosphatidyltransferase
MDALCSISLFALLSAIAIAYGVRTLVRGAARYDRVATDQGSALLGQGPMNIGYWALQPIGSFFVRIGISANAVSWGSLALGASAGTAIALGHFGLGSVLASACASCDALDGMVARKSGTASDAGEVLDAAIDRWVEFLFLGGIAVAYRASPWRLVLVLFALLGSFMVSYATAKAEALQVAAPRGAMRRTERAVYLLFGAALTPLVPFITPSVVSNAAARLSALDGLRDAPMIAALALVAVVANASAVGRLSRAAALVRLRAAPLTEPTTVEPLPATMSPEPADGVDPPRSPSSPRPEALGRMAG